jgi:hypothetical protein
MALFSESAPWCAMAMLDRVDIVRDGVIAFALTIRKGQIQSKVH